MKICRLGLLGQPGLLEGRLVLGMALSSLGRHDEVLQEMRVALESNPESAIGWLMKGEALIGKLDLRKAEDALHRARELEPSNPKSVQLLAAISRARAQGVVEVITEPTSTKEYPAPRAGGVKWRSASSVRFESPENAFEDSTALDARSRPQQDTQDSPPQSEPYSDEETNIDTGPNERLTADVATVAPNAEPLIDPIQRRAGPDEETMFGDSPAIGTPAMERKVLETPEPLESLRLATTDSSAEARARHEPTFENLESDEYTRLASRNASHEVEEQTDANVAEGRRRDQRTTEGARGFSTGSVPASDASISLSANDVVFAPAPSQEISADETPLPLPMSGPIEEEELNAEQRSWRDSNDVIEPVAEPFVDLHPRIASDHLDTEPPRSRRSSNPRHSPQPGFSSGGGPRAVDPSPTHFRPSAPQGARPPAPSAIRPHRRGLFTSVLDSLQPGGGRRSWLVVGVFVAGAAALAVVVGLLVREWRLRIRVAHRYELALKKTESGNFPGYQAAELLYRQILSERDDRHAAALRARVLAQLAFEFGEPPEPAQRALQALGNGDQIEEREARIYLSLAKGEVEVATRGAQALLKDHPGADAHYLLGQAELLLDQPEDAATALRSAAAEDAQNPIVLHALGTAEAALKHDDRAFEAYGKAIIANSNHVATIIDRALLQLHLGVDRDAAAGALEGVVGKLVSDASSGQLARAYVGLAEIELGKGNVVAARSALSSAAARRRDQPLLLEELAKAYADAFELDPAEREARRALALSGRLTPRLILAEVALRRSRPVQALTVLEESGASRPEALVLRALAKLELGRNSEARADAELALHVDPSLMSAQVALARIDIAESHYDVAMHRLDALEKLDPPQGKSADVAAALGQVFLAKRQPDRARTCFREALHRQPLLLEARLALARLLRDAGQLDEAREEVGRVLAINAAYVPARRELASLALDMGDAVAARDEFDALAERDADLDTLLGSARARLLLGDARGAEERVERALRLRPSGADLEAAQCLKARALLADHRPSEAIQLLLSVVRTADEGEPLALLIEAYIDYHRLDWAERAIDVAPVAARTGIEFTLAKARLAIEEARQSAGRSLAEEALQQLHTGHAPVWLRAQALQLLGRADFEQGNARGAWKSLKSALELDPRNVRAQYTLGLAALELKRPEDAVSAFEGALANDPRFSDAQFYLGRTRRELSDPRADEALRAYLDIDPKGDFAEEARGLLRGDAVTPTSDLPRSHRRGR